MRDRIVLDHLPLVKAIAVRVHENLPVHVDLDDLIHAGILGLFDAASKYDPRKGSFHSYAKHRIKGAILDSLRQLDWASRDLRRRHKQVEAATRELAAQFERQPTEAELADKMGVKVERWRQMVVELRTVGLISASGRGNDRDNAAAPEFPAKQEFQPDSICAKEELRDMLLSAMKTLPERYQKVVFAVLHQRTDHERDRRTARDQRKPRVADSQAALEKMAVVLQASGIHSSGTF